MKNTKPGFLFLILSYFLSSVEYTIALLLFAPLLLKKPYGLLPIDYDLQKRTILLTTLYIAYQFSCIFFVPLVGFLADRFGRSMMLKIILACSIILNLFTGLSIYLNSFSFLVLVRFFSGLCQCIDVLVKSIMPELYSGKQLKRLLCLIPSASGLALAIGPSAALFLSSKPLFNTSYPFYFLSFLYICSFIGICITLKDLKRIPIDQGKEKAQLNFQNIKKIYIAIFEFVLKTKSLHKLYISLMITYLGYSAFLPYFSPFLIEKYKESKAVISMEFSDFAIFFIAGIFFYSLVLIKLFSARNMYITSLTVLGVLLLTLDFGDSFYYTWVILAGIGMMRGITGSTTPLLVFENCEAQYLGTAYGSTTSLAKLASSIGVTVGGLLFSMSIYVPYFVSSVLILTASFYFWYKNGK